MELDDYQRRARATAFYPDAGYGTNGGLTYTALGLSGEAGEFTNKVKKLHRDGYVDGQDRGMALELGDVLWYVALAAAELGYSLDDIASANLAKLQQRSIKGKLGGSGDER